MCSLEKHHSFILHLLEISRGTEPHIGIYVYLCTYIHFFYMYISLYMQREIYFKELSHVMVMGAGKSAIHGVNQQAGDLG